MCIDPARRKPREAGLTMIELVMFIVIVSVAIAGVLKVLAQTSRTSTDPQLRKQALSIAEALLEEIELSHFTYCDAADENAATATGTGSCTIVENVGPETGNTRPFDNVNDYVATLGTPQAYTQDANGAPIAITGNYVATVTINQDAGLGPGGSLVPAAEALRISVKVGYGNNNDSVTLDGYRTRYAPTAPP